MSDRYDENLFLGFIEGDLSPAERLRFERQLAVDPALRQLVEQVRQDRQELRQTVPEVPPPQIMEAVNQALERTMLLEAPSARSDQAWRHHRLRLVRWSAYAAVAALALISTGVVVKTLLQPQIGPGQGPGAGPGGAPFVAGGLRTPGGTVEPAVSLALLSNNSRAEVGSGGQFAMLLPIGEESGSNRRLADADNNLAPASRQRLDAGATTGRNDKLREHDSPAGASGGRGWAMKGGQGNPADQQTTNQSLHNRGQMLVSNNLGNNAGNNVTSQRIEVVARNYKVTQANLVRWSASNGGTIIADSEPVFLGDNNANFNNNGNDNSDYVGNASRAGNNLGNGSQGKIALNNDLRETPQETNATRTLGNQQGGLAASSPSLDRVNGPAFKLQEGTAQQLATTEAASNQLRLTIVLAPEKVADLVRYFNSSGDQARLADAPGTPAPGANADIADAPAALAANPPATAAPVIIEKSVTALDREKGSDAFAGHMAKSVTAPGPGPGPRAELPGAAPTTPVPAAQATGLGQGGIPGPSAIAKDEAKKEDLRDNRFEPSPQSAVALVPSSLRATDWAGILNQQLPLNASLPLAEPPSSLAVPVIIVEQTPATGR